MLHDAVFQPQVIHEASGTVVVSPLLHEDEFADAIGLFMTVLAATVIEIFIDAIISRMAVKFVNAFFLPGFDMVRFTAFGQYAGFIIANGYQADAAPEAGSL